MQRHNRFMRDMSQADINATLDKIKRKKEMQKRLERLNIVDTKQSKDNTNQKSMFVAK